MWFEKPSQGFRIIATVKDEESRTENPQALVQKSSRGCIGRIGRGEFLLACAIRTDDDQRALFRSRRTQEREPLPVRRERDGAVRSRKNAKLIQSEGDGC